MGQSDSQASKHVVAASETIQIQEARYVSNNAQLLFEMEQKKLFKKKGKKSWKKTRFKEVGSSNVGVQYCFLCCKIYS